MLIRIGEDVFTGEAVVRGFAGQLGDWFEEGLGRFRPEGDTLVVDAMEGGYTAFCRKELPADILVRYTCRVLPPEGFNNINLISHCQPPKRGQWPIVELGRYKGYQAMPNYIVTFVSGKDEGKGIRECDGRQRLRRNPGFTLVDEKMIYPSELGRDYEITFAVQSGRVRYYIDRKKIFDWQDPQPLPGGYFGLRTYKTHEVYGNFVAVGL